MGAVEYSKRRAERDRQVAQLAAERARLETAPDAELDELTGLYVSRGLSPGLARQVAAELTAHDALAAHAEAEYGLTSASLASPVRDALAASAAFAAGAALPWLAIVLIPGPSRAPVIFLIVLAALALTGWISARISDVHPMLPMVRTASIGGLSMLITYLPASCSIRKARAEALLSRVALESRCQSIGSNSLRFQVWSNQGCSRTRVAGARRAGPVPDRRHALQRRGEPGRGDRGQALPCSVR
jgi:hypothetical protein